MSKVNFAITVEIERPYRVRASMYLPNGDFLDMVLRKTVPEALRALADEVETWAVNETFRRLTEE